MKSQCKLCFVVNNRYFEFEILTAGPMRVGWARADCNPGFQLGSDEHSWAFDGFNVRSLE